jgi:hypothetical protein
MQPQHSCLAPQVSLHHWKMQIRVYRKLIKHNKKLSSIGIYQDDDITNHRQRNKIGIASNLIS